jgi:hydrogenase maturation protease
VSPDTESVLVVGVGNELLGDEGLGVHVARGLLAAGDALPPHLAVLEAGTCLFDLLSDVSRYSRVIIVDAIRAGGEAGTVYRVELDTDFTDQLQATPPVSLHQWGLMETLCSAKMLGLLPKRLTVVGAEPEDIRLGTELSPRLARARDRIVVMLREEFV